jgi:hypothetical protein
MVMTTATKRAWTKVTLRRQTEHPGAGPEFDLAADEKSAPGWIRGGILDG